MKKCFLIAFLVLLLSGCVSYNAGISSSSTPAPAAKLNTDEIVSFQLNEKTDEYIIEYKANNVDFNAALSLGSGAEDANVTNLKWDKVKWDSFVGDVLASGILDSKYEDYVSGSPGEWSIALTGDFGVKTMSGAGSYPPKWQEFKNMLTDYFDETE